MAAALAAQFAHAQTAAEPVDLELVLAMDYSDSISIPEYKLQLEGTAEGFLDPGVQSAIRSGPYGRIAVIVMLWSDGSLARTNTGWHVLSDERSVATFAEMIRRFRVNPDGTLNIIGGGGTGIGRGVAEGLRLIESNAYEGLRKVIDVSGNGPETNFIYSQDIRIGPAGDLAEAMGVTVNGLAIVTPSEPDLTEYYRREVIAGPGAFVIEARGIGDFGRALRDKLLREIHISIGAAPHSRRVR